MARTQATVDDWLAAQAAPNTRAAYGGDVANFLGWCAGTGRRPLSAKPADIDAYREACLADGASNATVARRLSGLASFFRYAAGAGAARVNPVDGVARPAPTSTDDEDGLTGPEVSSILRAAATLGSRTAALVGLLARDGLKLAEVLAVDVPAIRFHRGAVTIGVLRRHEHVEIDLDANTGEAVTACVGDRRDGPLFVGESAASTGTTRLTRFGADFLIKRASAAANIDKAVSANALLRAQRAGLGSPAAAEAAGDRHRAHR